MLHFFSWALYSRMKEITKEIPLGMGKITHRSRQMDCLCKDLSSIPHTDCFLVYLPHFTTTVGCGLGDLQYCQILALNYLSQWTKYCKSGPEPTDYCLVSLCFPSKEKSSILLWFEKVLVIKNSYSHLI